MRRRHRPAPGGPTKLDGYQVDTHDRFRARSRRGWAMAELVPGSSRPCRTGLMLDGELVSFDDERLDRIEEKMADPEVRAAIKAAAKKYAERAFDD